MFGITIREIHILRGPNIRARHPVLEAWVDCGRDGWPGELPEFSGRLRERLPGLTVPDAGFPAARALVLVALELQRRAGHAVEFGMAEPTSVAGLWKVVTGYVDESVAEACLHGARELVLAAARGAPFDLDAEIERLRDAVDTHALGPSTKSMVDAAAARGIPWRRLEAGRSLIQLGYGAKQRRIWTAETDQTGAIAEFIAKDKDLTRAVLKKAGVPVPEGRIVTSADDAWEAAEAISPPVVVKPRDANHGRGVFVDMRTREQVAEVFPHAAKYGDGVIVERFIPGVDHRLLVVGDRMVAANRGEPAIIVGDGTATVHELIESQLNSDPRRGAHDTAPWAKIDTVDWDPTVVADLQKQGHTISTVPRDGERVLVSRFANPSVDVTDEVHPSVSEHVVVAARTAGLDICGVDVVCRDISRPLEEQGGAVVEINASPGLHIHLEPAVGQGRPVGEAIIGMLFPGPASGRIPIVGVSGSRGKTSTVRLIAHLLSGEGRFVAACSSDGLQIGRRHTEFPGGDRIAGARGVLLHPWTEIAVCEAGEESILTEGLGFDQCTVGVVLNTGADDLGLAYIHTMEQMAMVHRCIVDAVLPEGTAVLNAMDPLVAEMAGHCRGRVIQFTSDPDNAVAAKHQAAGGQALLIRDGAIRLAENGSEHTVCLLKEIPVSVTGHFAFQLDNLLAATAAALALGLSDTDIAAGLRSLPPE